MWKYFPFLYTNEHCRACVSAGVSFTSKQEAEEYIKNNAQYFDVAGQGGFVESQYIWEK